jgi:hypothetical protein
MAIETIDTVVFKKVESRILDVIPESWVKQRWVNALNGEVVALPKAVIQSITVETFLGWLLVI